MGRAVGRFLGGASEFPSDLGSGRQLAGSARHTQDRPGSLHPLRSSARWSRSVIVAQATPGGSTGETKGGETARATRESLTSLQESLTQLLGAMGLLASAVGEVARAAGEVAEAAGAERGSRGSGRGTGSDIAATAAAAAAAAAATSAAAAAAAAGGEVAKAAAAAAGAAAVASANAAAAVAPAAPAAPAALEAAAVASARGGRGKGLEGHELALALQRAFVQARIEGLGKPKEEALNDFVDACMAARAHSLGFKDLQLKLLLAEAALPAPFSMMGGDSSWEGGEERVEKDLDSDDERRDSSLKALRGPFLAEEVRVRTLWVRLVYTTLNTVDNIKRGEGYEGVVSADGLQPPEPTDGFVQQTIKAAFDQGRDYEFVRREQETQLKPVPLLLPPCSRFSCSFCWRYPRAWLLARSSKALWLAGTRAITCVYLNAGPGGSSARLVGAALQQIQLLILLVLSKGTAAVS
ncbi:hypothetical protein CLOM_g17419 [Closterium sp. NIES-68]|nr:hypothetical protein CLOM_g17419 [Closterium sp. NIES-68]